MLLGFHLIIGVTVFVAVGLVVTYSISVAADHVPPLWCYISYTGNYPVESCIFSLVFNLCSAIYILIVFLRYVQVFDILGKSDLPEKKTKRVGKLNLASVVLGAGGAFGLSMTGCFQQRVFHLVHIIGVVFCVYFTFAYISLQTYFTFALPLLATSRFIKGIRAAVAGVSGCILACGPFISLFFFVRRRSFNVVESNTSGTESVSFRLGASLEWLLFVLNQIFICSFCPDFKKIAVGIDKILFL